MTHAVFKLEVVCDDPRFDGFGMGHQPSILGRDSLDDDLTAGFDDNVNPNWTQPRLAKLWNPPKVEGRVRDYNDYPGLSMVYPAFSERAVKALSPMLEENGELLPLDSKTKMRYFFFNILTISDAFDKKHSTYSYDRSHGAGDVEYFSFHKAKLKGLSIFRIREWPVATLVTDEFVRRVDAHGLQGFSFTKVWPLPKSVNWRNQTTDAERARLRKLKQNTLVLVFEMPPRSPKKVLAELEDRLDEILAVDSPRQKYFGSLEGSEKADGQYRMFLSCPDVEQLLKKVRSVVESIEWPHAVRATMRKGALYDVDAREKTVELKS